MRVPDIATSVQCPPGYCVSVDITWFVLCELLSTPEYNLHVSALSGQHSRVGLCERLPVQHALQWHQVDL